MLIEGKKTKERAIIFLVNSVPRSICFHLFTATQGRSLNNAGRITDQGKAAQSTGARHRL